MTAQPRDALQVRASRRMVFSGMAALGVAVTLAGCAGGDDGESSPDVAAGEELTTTGEVPVGGGIVLTDHKIVVTQPEEGVFKAFTAVCTHQGLLVTGVGAGRIDCDNHGSRFSLTDGSVEQGPATSALAEVPIRRDGDRILAA